MTLIYKLAAHRGELRELLSSHGLARARIFGSVTMLSRQRDRGTGAHSLSTRSALRKHTASRSVSLNGAVSMNRAASSLSSSG